MNPIPSTSIISLRIEGDQVRGQPGGDLLRQGVGLLARYRHACGGRPEAALDLLDLQDALLGQVDLLLTPLSRGLRHLGARGRRHLLLHQRRAAQVLHARLALLAPWSPRSL